MIRALIPLILTFAFPGVEYRIRNIVSGISLMIASGFFILLAIVCGLMSIFFSLADLDTLISPSLITGGISILVAILFGIQGKRVLVKKPIRSIS